MKNFITLAAAILLLAGPGTALASDPSDRFCAEVAEASERMVRAIYARSSSLEEKRAARLEILAEAWDAQDALRAAAARQAGALETDFAALEESMPDADPARKQAFADFKDSLRMALAKKQAAVDSAVREFRSAATGIMEARSDDVRQAAGEFASSVRESLGAAVSGCAAGFPPDDLRAGMQAGLDSARRRFKADPRLAAAGPADLGPAAERYRTALRKAADDFRKEVLAARDRFKAALAA